MIVNSIPEKKIVLTNKVISVKYISINFFFENDIGHLTKRFYNLCEKDMKINKKNLNIEEFIILKKNFHIKIFLSFLDKNPTMRKTSLIKFYKPFFTGFDLENEVLIDFYNKTQFSRVILENILTGYVIEHKLSKIILQNERTKITQTY